MKLRISTLSRIALPLLLLVEWGFMTANLAQQSMWIDEWFTVQNVAGPWANIIPKLIAEERRPPLYWLVLKSWTELSGHSEFAIRIFSVSCAALTVALIWQIGKRLLPRSSALLAACAFGLTPFVLLYGRMMRSYMLFALLTALSVLCWSMFMQRSSRKTWGLYVLSLVGMLYTDYGAVGVLGVHGLWWLWHFLRTRGHSRLAGISASIVAGIVFLPWATVLVQQSARSVGGTAADLAFSPVGMALKMAMPFVSLSIGETLYPWTVLGILGVLMLNAAALFGLWKLLRSTTPTGIFLALWVGVTLVFTATLLSFVAVDITFMNATSRAPHLAVAYALLAAHGIHTFTPRLRTAAIGIIIIVWGAAFANFYALRDFHNPIYAVPTREIAQRMHNANADTLLIAESDTLVPYYYAQAAGAAKMLTVTPGNEMTPIQQRIAVETPARIQIAWFGRDRTSSSFGTPELASWLTTHSYYEVQRDEYGPVGDSYQRIKSMLVKHETYAAKLTVQVFEKK